MANNRADSHRKYLSLANAAAVINAELEINQILHVIMLNAKEILEAEACSLFLIDPSQNMLYCEVALGERGEMLRKYLRLEMGAGIAGWTAQHRTPVMIENAYLDPRFDPAWDKKSGFHTKSLLCVPMFHKTKLIGTLEVMNKTGDRVFDESDLEIITALADIAAVSIENARLRESLKKRILELTLLYQFEKETSVHTRLDLLGRWVLDKCLDFLEARIGTIYIYDENENLLKVLAARGLSDEAIREILVRPGEGIAGWVAERRLPVLVQDLPSDPRYNAAAKYTYETNSLISAPLLYQNKLIGVISINNKINGFAFSQSDLNMLEAIANRLALTIRNAQLHEEIHREREDRERARRLIAQILPTQLPLLPKNKVAVRYLPYSEVGGDFYTFFNLPQHRTGLLVVDVSGHGMSAAMIAIMANTVISTFDERILCHPAVFFRELNNALVGRLAGNFLTAIYAVLDFERGVLLQANAGHPYPILANRRTGELSTLSAAGKFIGVIPDLIFEEIELKLSHSRLVCYTDGILEITSNDQKKMYTEEEFKEAVSATLSENPNEAADNLIQYSLKACGRSAFDDDVTLLVVDID